MALLTRFSIIVVPFPYADQLAEKRRPALVISPGGILSATNVIWVAMITSAKNLGWAGDILIANFAKSGLPAPSVIRPLKLATIDVDRVQGVLGQLETKEQQKVLEFFRNSFE